MILDIFEATKNWDYSEDDKEAQQKINALADDARNHFDKDFYKKTCLYHQEFKKTELYHLIKEMPKGCLHNTFFNCNEDTEFYRKHIANDPNIYVTQDWTTFRIGTKETAELYNWISMEQARKMYTNENDFIKAISNITIVSEEELKRIWDTEDYKFAWNIFLHKMKRISTLIYSLHIFKKYLRHVFLKYINNGYQRIQFRAELVKLIEYDIHGKLLTKHSEKKYMEVVDEVYDEIHKEYPFFTIGFIFCGFKSMTDEENENMLEEVCKLNWSKTIGFDFTQEEDKYGTLDRYDSILNKVLEKYPEREYSKIYHAGETNDHLSKNIQIAVESGSKRIGHGLNILQRVQFLPYCQHVCFEKCPISNLVLGYNRDLRESSAPVLLGLGYNVSLNPGDSAKFGLEDSTGQFFVSLLAYNWTLKHLKLVALHSINHSVCHENVQHEMIKSFNLSWDKWIDKILSGKHKQKKKPVKTIDIFTKTNNWSWNEQDNHAFAIFEKMRIKAIKDLPEDFHRIYTMTHVDHIRSSELFEVMKDLPKGALHHDHVDCNEDEQFYRQHIVTDPNIYLAQDKKTFKIGNKEQALEGKWVSFPELRKQFNSERQFIKFVSNITMLNKQELKVVSTRQQVFWVLFEQKISNFFILVFTLHIWKKYIKHVLLKYIKCGYERVEFRALLCELDEYDQKGNFVKKHDHKMYMDSFDEVYDEVKKSHPNFTIGFIFFGLKMLTQQQNFQLLDKVCSYQWKHTIGIDFVQQEDPHGSMEPYIRVGDRVVEKYKHLHLKKVYHAGETMNHLNNNVELSVRSGSVRIGHGLNIVRRMEDLPLCRHICFELNPISNLLTGGLTDIRTSTAPLLLGLGYAVSISPDDPGKFGYEDTTVDYFASVVGFNWTLKHLKLIAYHSINHSIVTEGERTLMVKNFNKNWDEWIKGFIKKQSLLNS